MTTTEDRLRAALHARASAVIVDVSARRRRRRPRAVVPVAAGLATVLALTAGIAIARHGRSAGPTGPVGQPTARAMRAAPLSERSQASVTWTGSQLFVWGGTSADGKVATDGALYDPRLDEWTSLHGGAPIPPQIGAVAIAINTHVYVLGGGLMVPSSTTSPTSAAYDTASGGWAPVPAPPTCVSAATQLDGTIVAAGHGCQTEQSLRATTGDLTLPTSAPVVRFDPATNEWSSLAPVPTPYIVVRLLVWNGQLVAQDFVGDVWLRTPNGAMWTKLPRIPEVDKHQHGPDPEFSPVQFGIVSVGGDLLGIATFFDDAHPSGATDVYRWDSRSGAWASPQIVAARAQLSNPAFNQQAAVWTSENVASWYSGSGAHGDIALPIASVNHSIMASVTPIGDKQFVVWSWLSDDSAAHGHNAGTIVTIP
jgi:hypothetical protein